MSQLQTMQAAEQKKQVRNHIVEQTVSFAKQTKEEISTLSLPCTEWTFEKLLTQICSEKNVPIRFMAGVENGYYKDGPKIGSPIYPDVVANKPPKATVYQEDFNRIAVDTVVPIPYNFIWADYCGNPAKAEGNGRFSYLPLQTFIQVAKNAIQENRKLIYYMTFCCNGRIKGGKKALVKAMGGTSVKTMPQAICNKISALLSQEKMIDKVSRILFVHYHGGSRSFMVTVGYAVNFIPSFPIVKIDMNKSNAKNKSDNNAVDLVDVKTVIRILLDKQWDTKAIAKVLKINPRTVSSVKAWHNNRKSWSKTEK